MPMKTQRPVGLPSPTTCSVVALAWLYQRQERECSRQLVPRLRF